MGQKVHPYGLRLGYIKPWKARWFAKRDAGTTLMEDLKIRAYLKKKLAIAGISSIEIDRASNRVRIRIFAAKPGVIIGRRGQEIDKIKEDLAALTKNEVFLDIKEVKMPQIDAQLVAENIVLQLEKRIGFRRAMKKSIQLAMQKGALGIKVQCKGRLGGAEIAREEKYHEGKVPLSTFRADIDYGFAEAFTTYGTIGCKTWIYKGDVLVKKEQEAQKLELEKKFKVVDEEAHKTEAVEADKSASEVPQNSGTQENKSDAPTA
ncbi:MAG: 30S ribosomal protein S3 [Omnitrophica bacterium RIFOXYB12_FULL_50_7]|nr:MAG: 30S ribosomal protein S3 [Omnitrophica bacterium RIFOXYB12_FULL_50_7]